MFREKQYYFNKETLSYDIKVIPLKVRLRKVGIAILVGLACFFLYYYLFTWVFGLKMPKTFLLESRNKELIEKMNYLNQKVDEKTARLEELQRRDNLVYRPIFGMDEISDEVREAGFGGIDKYADLNVFPNSSFLTETVMNMDILTKKTYVQCKSFDEVELLAERADNMASCVPSIFPVITDARSRFSSPFGYRVHPIKKRVSFHQGIDISGLPVGEPVYATGDGVVIQSHVSFYGYGTLVVIDHGMGYKTKYAHLKATNVAVGQVVHRGQQIAELGNTGSSTGPHLHYEVLYKDKAVNPKLYFDRELPEEDYRAIIERAKEQ